MNSVNFLSTSYQSMIAGRNDEPQLLNLNKQRDSLARMIVNIVIPNDRQLLYDAIAYGQALEEFFQTFDNEDELRFLPSQNLIA